MFQDLEHIRQVVVFAVLMILGFIARNLISDEPFRFGRFMGEMILTGIGALALCAAGVLQGLDGWQMLFLASASSLGGLRAVEWTLKIAQAVRSARV